jgi:hypothetical protein
MITSEQAFDMLPYVGEIFDKLEIPSYINSQKKILTVKKGQNVNDIQEKIGIGITVYVVKNCNKVKEEFFNVVAIAKGKSIEEVKQQGLVETIKTFKEIFQDPELMGFFKTAMQ